MRIVILFGGGDAGGIIITPNGVEPIPPFDPGILAAIKAITAVSQLERATDGARFAEELGEFSAQTLSDILPRIDEQVGGLHTETGLVVLSEDGDGWFCGTVPRKPIPFPPHPGWPKLQSRFGRLRDQL